MRRILVAGLGRFGGGRGALDFFLSRGDEVLVSDQADASVFEDVVSDYSAEGRVTFRFGAQTEELLKGIDLVVGSPALPLPHPLLLAARQRSIEVTTELELFCRHCRGQILAVTGSNGKTTTAHLLRDMLHQGGEDVALGGNMGISLLPEVDRFESGDLVVIEISNFQLERFRLDQEPPFCGALLTGLTPNHLDRHRDFDDYAEQKARLVSLCQPGSLFVFPEGSPFRERWRERKERAHVHFVGPDSLPAGLDQRLGEAAPHGLIHKNARLAARLALAVRPEIKTESLVAGVAQFRGLEDRLEVIHNRDGLVIVNDSKATTPEATAAAVDAFDQPIDLVIGGSDKGLDPTCLIEAAKKCRRVLLLGATAERLATELSAHQGVEVLNDFETMLDRLLEAPLNAGVRLFSPGHASFDHWPNYRARGEAFKDGVHKRLQLYL